MKARARLLCGVLLYALGMSAQSGAVPDASGPQTGTFRIAGRVVNALSGHGISGARVEIRSTGGGPVVGSAVADEAGAFAFAAVKAGGYSMTGEARGYGTAAYEAHGVYSTAIVTGVGVDTGSLVLKLTPEARVSGRITDESGEAVRHASVELFRENRASGVLRVDRWRTASTDDLGAYEFARLPPGRYFLAAQGRPWYAVQPQPVQGSGTFSNVGIVDSVEAGLDVAYPLLFYPGVTDSDSASALTVKGGEQMEVDLRLVPQAAVSISIPRAAGQRQVGYSGLQTMVFGQLQQVNAQMRGAPDAMVFEGVPTGQYVLKEMPQQGGGVARTYAVNASGASVVVEEKSAQELGRVVVRAESADGAPLPPQMAMALLSGDARPLVPVGFNGKTEGKAEGVVPGSYRLVRNGGMAGYFIQKLMVEGKEMTGQRLRVAAGATVSATAVVGVGTAILTGRAMRDGKPSSGAMVLLVPAGDTVADDAFWRDQSDLDGSFRLPNVPPGNYLLVAIEDGWELEWKRPEVLARYLPQGLAVVVPEGGRRIKLSDTAAQLR